MKFEEVARARDQLLREGKPATRRAVQQLLRGGSLTTIQKHLTQLEQADEANAPRVSDQTISALNADFRRQVTAGCLHAASQHAEDLEDIQQLEAEVAILNDKVQELHAEHDGLRDQVSHLLGQISTLKDEHQQGIASRDVKLEALERDLRLARDAEIAMGTRLELSEQQRRTAEEEVRVLKAIIENLRRHGFRDPEPD